MQIALQEHLDRLRVLHPRLCPRQVIGVRMARLACNHFAIDPVMQRKQLFVYMEMGRCVADGVIMVTGASPTNYMMKLVDYGKVAATFVDLRCGDALRICEHPDSRHQAMQMIPGIDVWEAQLAAYQVMPDNRLLRWEPVCLIEPLPQINDKYSVICQQCQARVHEHAHVLIDAMPMCKACAYGSYYIPAESIEKRERG